MTATRFARLAEIVPHALDLDADDRDAFLDHACTRADGTADGALLAEASALLAADAAADAAGALRSPVAALAGHELPERVGPWRVRGVLGEGGMGVVYAAERAGPGFTQRAAVKRVRPGTGGGFEARFLRERGLLAGLDHVGIARLLDAGVDAAGAPYLAMERVDGAAITADGAGRPLAERLALFADACDAVAYAHRNLVVHRDLKPAHIVVERPPGGAARVRLLDFGIAKLLDDATGTATAGIAAAGIAELTQTGPGPLTPQYAAPEQIRGERVTTATDVYALGLVLFELLADRRPYTLAGLSPGEAERTVCDAPPPLPSAVAPADRARALRGDLDTVVMKALAKEPARRYPSADALAADLRRYAAGLPVEARPATAAYRTATFLRRHRALATATALSAVLLVAVSGAFTARVLAERDRARDEAATAAAVTDVLRATFAAANPTSGASARSAEVRLADALRAGLAGADTALADRPAVRAAVLVTLGRTMVDLGLTADAVAPLREAARLQDALHAGAPHPDQVEAADALALVAMWQPAAGDAEALFERSLDLRRAVYGPQSAEAAVGMANLAEQLVEQNEVGRAQSLVHRALAVVAAGPERESVAAGEVLFVYAVVSLRAGHVADADAAFAELLAFARHLAATGAIAADDDRIATILVGLGQTRLLGGQTAEAVTVLREALARREARYEAGHPVLAEAQALCGIALLDAGRAAEAAVLLRAAAPGLAGGDPYTEQRHLARLALARADPRRAASADTLRADAAAVRSELGAAHPWSRRAARAGSAGTRPVARPVARAADRTPDRTADRAADRAPDRAAARR